MEKEAHISISMKDGRIEVSGSESFEREQVENFKGIILKTLSNIPQEATSPQTSRSSTTEVETDTPAPEHQNVLALDGDHVKILPSIPGKNKREQSVNVALLYVHGKSLKGEDSATFDEIRKVCEEHACLDSPNFSKALKGKKQFFLLSGTDRNKVVRLSHPGKIQASTLVEELNVT